MEKYGARTTIGNKQVIKLRYTDLELSSRVVRFLHYRGYILNKDYTVQEYIGAKNRRTSTIEAILVYGDLPLIMAIKQRRISEIALKKAKQLELTF